jgi:ribosomal protein S18 acetylase RimI-like enzyme
MLASSIQTAAASDADRLVNVLVLAFSADPVTRWAFPEPNQYLSYFPEFVRRFGGGAFAHGTAHYVDGWLGAALWLPPGTQPDEDAMVELLQRAVAEPQQEALFAMLEAMGRHHPREPHWYLPLIGVDPICQGQGHGSALLRHALARCDREGTLAYLESSNPANLPLYERHGFAVVGTIQVGTAPPLWPMVRQPRS